MYPIAGLCHMPCHKSTKKRRQPQRNRKGAEMAAASGALSALAAAGALASLDPGALGGALSADAGGAASPGGSPGLGAPKSWCFEA